MFVAVVTQTAYSQAPKSYPKRVKTNSSLEPVVLGPSSVQTTLIRPGFPIQVQYTLYRFRNLKKEDVKGVVLLCNYDNAESALLTSIAGELSGKNYLVAIIKHRSYLATGFNAQADTLGKDLENVWKEITSAYGGTVGNTVIGGISFAGFATSYLVNNPSVQWLKGIKGIALIAAGTSAYVPVPVVNRVCKDDPDVDTYGNNGGANLQNELDLKNPAIAALSTCITDPVCSGHNTHDSWAAFFVTAIRKWLP